MNELQLVGYTADLKYLVFSDAVDGARFKVPVDDDLVATLSEVLQLIDPDRTPFAPAEPEPQAPPWVDDWAAQRQEAAPSLGDLLDEEPPPPPPPTQPPPRNGRRSGPKPGEGALAAFAALAEPAPVGPARANGLADAKAVGSKLSPRSIQALLRSGMAPRQVARRAETDEAWVRRWLPPIEAERRLVLEAVEQARVTKSRLGESRDLLGEAVRKNLAEKGLGADDETVEWQASKREGDPHWSVTLQYRSRGRKQRALWHFNPDTGELDPRNALAVDVAWTRPRKAGRGRGASVAAPTRKAMTAKKASPARKGTAKKAAAKKAPAKKAPAKKAPAKKAPAKKAAPARKTAGKKAPVKKAAAKKPPAKKKAPAKKPSSRRTR